MASNKLNFACFNLKAPLYGQICYIYNKTPKVDIHAEIYTAFYCCQADALRSEEHTSELQSHSDLVCRLLLGKKKKHKHAVKLRGQCYDILMT